VGTPLSGRPAVAMPAEMRKVYGDQGESAD